MIDKIKNIYLKVKKTLKYLLLITIAICLFFAGRYSNKSDGKIKIVKETKTVYKIKRVPYTMEEFAKCYQSQIKIIGTMKNNWIHITAGDYCKESKKSFKLEAENKTMGVVAGIQVGVGLTGSLTPNVYVGVGVTYGFIFLQR